MRLLNHEIEAQLPCMRRHARAMSGNRELGDSIAMHAMVSFLHDDRFFYEGSALKVVLFRALQDARIEIGAAGENPVPPPGDWLSELPRGSRDAFLLRAFEDFSHEEIATILRRPFEEIEGLLAVARKALSNMIPGRILLIEDELAVVAELTSIIMDMGLSVIGAAATGAEAITIVEEEEPDLILSDIQLADGSSGIRAVNTILRSYPMTPVVYVTGFPEQLLTGEGPEPAFLVKKPYTRDQVRSAVSQALFFA